MTVKSYVARTDECHFHDLPEFFGSKSINHDMQVFTVENATSFHPQCLDRVETRFCDAQVATVCRHTLCRIELDAGICFANSSFVAHCEHSSLSLRLCGGADYSFLVYWFEGKVHHLGFGSK